MPVQRLTMNEISSSPSTGRCDWRRFSHSSCFLRMSPWSSRSLVAQRRRALEVLVADGRFLLAVHLLELAP